MELHMHGVGNTSLMCFCASWEPLLHLLARQLIHPQLKASWQKQMEWGVIGHVVN
jgi:hypothetical protein